MRSIGLDVDGPARWGTRPPTRSRGVFVVEAAQPSSAPHIDLDLVRDWIELVPSLRLDGERPTQTVLAERLASFWVPGQALLYVGRSTKALAARVAALYATELGYRRPHAGGHWLKTLREPARLRLWWAETDAPEEYEDALIGAFAEAVPDDVRRGLPGSGPILPWANLESPTAGARDTGLSASLLDADTQPSRSSGVQRSDRSATPKRRAAGRASTPRSPRRTANRSTAGGTAAKREEPTHLTAEGLAALRSEHEQLTTTERAQVIERVKHARELGDLRENADYEAARNEQSFLEGRILELEQRLRTAVVIGSSSGGSVSMGSRVRYELDGQPGQLTIVGSTESDPSAGLISAASPVGRALLGHRAGDEVAVRTPAAEIRYRIIAVEGHPSSAEDADTGEAR